jgi:hypothetical protein
MKGVIAPKDYSAKRGPGSVDTRDAALGRKPAAAADQPAAAEKDA